VEAICSRAIIIDLGKIIADDTIVNLKEKSGSNLIHVEFDKAVSKTHLKKISGIVSCNSINEMKWEIITAGDIDIRKELFRFAVERDITVLSLEKGKSSMEDLFRRLTAKQE
jgi:ABC-2 type transport system ATP-binding protein